MNEKATEIALLIAKQMSNALTDEERQFLTQWTQASEENRQFTERFYDPNQLQQLLREYFQTRETLESLTSSSSVLNLKATSRFKINYRYVAAAIIFLIGTCAFFYLISPLQTNSIAKTEILMQDVQPGGQKATLILADKSVIDLTDVPEGIVAHQGETTIKKMKGGDLKYEGSGISGINILATPRGGMYNISFSDGSKVWLNAESSVRYPATFTGNKRKVELLSGEAYFEVAKNEKIPFIVQTSQAEIEVLGTRFNIQSYNTDEKMVTTLVEGSVKIVATSEQFSNKSSTILKPGQQATIGKKDTNTLFVENADAESSISWVSGSFYFSESSLPEVMRQLSRWFDKDIVYDPGVSMQRKFKGSIERTIPLSKVLSQLERMSDLRFTIRDKSIIVSKAMK